MSQPEPVSQWIETVSSAFPKLSRPQAKVLAYWSYGMVLAKSCGIILVCAALAIQLGCKEASLVQRLREWCYGAKDKHGSKRRELDVSSCFAPLLGWILSWWPADEPRLALALDATTLKKRTTRAVHQRGLSRLRSARGLVHRGSGRTGSMETGLDRFVERSGWGHSCAVDSDRAG